MNTQIAPDRTDRVAAATEAVAPPALPAAVAEELRAVVGADGLLTDPGDLLVYEADGLMLYRVPPRAVVRPQSTDQVARVVRILAREGIPFVPRGAGTGLSGGALPLGGAVIVCLSRMNRILSLDPHDRRARVEAGVITAQLDRAAAAHGLTFLPDPGSQTVSTLGGNVAENAGGPHCLKYGVTMNHVVGLTVVLSDGEVVELGGAGETVGYDLLGVFIGSEGTFGLATEIEVRLSPRPEAAETILAIFGELADAGRAVSSIIAEGLLPAAMEIIDRETIRAVEESVYAAGYPLDAGAALVVEFDGPRAGLAAQAQRARAVCEREGAREVRLARDDAERARLWHGRKKAFGALGRLAPDVLIQDAVVPRTRLPEVLARVQDVSRRHGIRIANFFHAGDGNLHPNLLFDRRDETARERVERASKEIMQACVDAGGTITGEHGVGFDKMRYMPLIFGPAELRAMAAVKRAFDPAGLCNPGKVVPDVPVPAHPTATAPGVFRHA